MYKKVIFAAVLCLLSAAFSSCSNDESFDSSVNPSNELVLVPVTVTTTGFGISQQDFFGTRATAVGDHSKVKFLTLAFYASDGTEVYKHTQVRDDNTTYTTFGEFTTSLMYGSYTMVVIANDGNHAITLTSPTVATYGENTVLDTWTYTQAVNITSNDAVNLSATLDRICSAVTVQSTDNRPAGVTHMRLTCSAGGKGFDPTTGFATSNTGVSVTMELADATLGGTTYYGGYLFLATDEQTMDVTVETLDAADGNVLFSKTVENVPLKRNRRTKLTGAIYSGSGVSTSGFQVDTDWLTTHNMGF